MVDLSTTLFPLIPLRDVVVFPQMVTPLFVSRQKSIAALEQALMRDDRLVVLVAQKDAETEDPKLDDLYQVGTLAEVMQMLKLPDGTVKVLVEGSMRVALDQVEDGPEHFASQVSEMTEILVDDETTRTLIKISVEKFEQYVKSTKKINPESLLAVSGIGQPGRLADIIATYLGLHWPNASAAWKLPMLQKGWSLLANCSPASLSWPTLNSKYTTKSDSIWKKPSANIICAKNCASFKMS